MLKRWERAAVAALLVSLAGTALALDRAAVAKLTSDDNDVKLEGIKALVEEGDPAAIPVLQRLAQGEVEIDGKVVEVVANNRIRAAVGDALAGLRLVSPDRAARAAAAAELAKGADAATLPLIRRALAAEKDPDIRDNLALAAAAIELQTGDRATRLAAIRTLGDSASPASRTLLAEVAREEDADVRRAAQSSLAAVEGRLAWGERLGLLFAGVSLGSILLLAALGLAITYGLMGVINMAHGELIMIGAYSTYVVQNLFRAWLPGAFDFYLVAAVPAAFVVSAAVGMLLERSVIRWLYGRPLETLLATWGISLVLIQLVRTVFGAQNVQVENPAFMSGGVQALSNLVLPWSRIWIIAFAALVLAGMGLLLARTRLGLFVRGVTQNRAMASCVGVPTARVDTYAFGLGSGIAGLAGCALSQLGNVGPDLGQGYIVDSFMVVVFGGVGQLAGTVYAALTLGFANKFLEAWSGAVIAKIAVLVFIIFFIQRRPQGLFALKGRAVEA